MTEFERVMEHLAAAIARALRATQDHFVCTNDLPEEYR